MEDMDVLSAAESAERICGTPWIKPKWRKLMSENFGAGSVCIVTGAVSGIGAAISNALLAKECRVVGLDINETLGETFAPGNSNFKFIKHDVRNRSACWDVVQQVIATSGSVVVLINTAGVVGICSPFDKGKKGPLDKPAIDRFNAVADEWERQRSINLDGYMYMFLAVADHMRARNSGDIAFLASVAGYDEMYERFAYCVSKAGADMMIRAGARDFAYADAPGVRLWGIAPCRVLTPLMEKNLDAAEARGGQAAREAEFASYGWSQYDGKVLTAAQVATHMIFHLENPGSSGVIYQLGGWKGQPWAPGTEN